MMNRSILEDIKLHEGFRGMPYDDHLGNPTIGYGTLLPLNEAESEALLQMRLDNMVAELVKAKKEFTNYPIGIQHCLMNMAYNMGVPRLMGFQKMFQALDAQNYESAAREALDSKWAQQVGHRALEIANIIRKGE